MSIESTKNEFVFNFQFFFFKNRRRYARVKDEYNMWETWKIMRKNKKNISIKFIILLIFNFILSYLLT